MTQSHLTRGRFPREVCALDRQRWVDLARRAVGVLDQDAPRGERVAKVSSGALCRVEFQFRSESAHAEAEHTVCEQRRELAAEHAIEVGGALLRLTGAHQPDHCPTAGHGEPVAVEGAAAAGCEQADDAPGRRDGRQWAMPPPGALQST